jgi:hypothetical protein
MNPVNRMRAGLAGFLLVIWPLRATGADRLAVSTSVCLISICPGNPPPAKSVASGDPFNLYVEALLHGGLDTSYLGTVTFSSTDPLATLPPAYSFGPSDGGRKAFGGVVLRTLGPQTITGTDSVNGLSGSVTLVVTGSTPVSVPLLSPQMKALSALLIALVGFWLARLRR